MLDREESDRTDIIGTDVRRPWKFICDGSECMLRLICGSTGWFPFPLGCKGSDRRLALSCEESDGFNGTICEGSDTRRLFICAPPS